MPSDPAASPASSPHSRDSDALGDMPAEEFRAQAHRLVDWIADYLAHVGERPVLSQAPPGTVRAALPKGPPQAGTPMKAILDDVDEVILPGITHWNHPAFFAYFNSSGSGPGILGELLTAALNVNAMLWQTSPAATELEQAVLDWLRQMLGLPEGCWGIIYEGGSASNLHGIAAAREHVGLDLRQHGLAGRPGVPRLRIYATEHAHSSVDKAAITLGIGLDGIRCVPVDDAYRMRPDALAAALAEDRQAGWLPVCVVASAGTTSCTSIDPLDAVADVCAREEVWLHVDAAHGGALALLPEARAHLAGWERADSVVVNPHKWFFVPLDLSVLFTRWPEVLRRAFSLVPEYLRTVDAEPVEHFMNYGITLGRRFRALKLWFVLRYFGAEGLAARVRNHLRLARQFAAWVDAHPHFERLAPVPMSTVCFRARPAGRHDAAVLDALNERLMAAVNASGAAYLSHTRLDGRFALRLVASGLRTEAEHVRRAWDVLQELLAREEGGQEA